MKRVYMLALSMIGLANLSAQKVVVAVEDNTAVVQENTSEFHPFAFHAGVETNHLWRGLIISDMPSVTGMLSYYFDPNKQWRIGIWGGMAIARDSDDTHYKEVDYFVEYSSKYFTIGLWDLFNTRSIEHPEVFNYSDDETTHLIDVRTNYYLGDNFPMRLKANVLLYGTGDQQSNENLDEEDSNDQKYSTYVEASYPIYTSNQIDVNLHLGAGFALDGDTHLYGDGDNKVDVVNVGVDAFKYVQIGNFTLPVHGGVMWNPSNEYVRMQIAADLF